MRVAFSCLFINFTSQPCYYIRFLVCLVEINNTYRIMAILKVETDIIANIAASPIGRTGIFMIMSVEAFRTDVIGFIGDVIMCVTSD